MKINIEIDLTPKEARSFFGLPDVEPVNQAMMKKVQERIDKGYSAEEIDAFIRSFIMGASGSFSELQKGLWNVMKSATSKSGKKDG